MSEIYDVISDISHKKLFVANKKHSLLQIYMLQIYVMKNVPKLYLTGINWPNYCFILITKLMEIPGIEPGASHMQTELQPHFPVFPVVQ